MPPVLTLRVCISQVSGGQEAMPHLWVMGPPARDLQKAGSSRRPPAVGALLTGRLQHPEAGQRRPDCPASLGVLRCPVVPLLPLQGCIAAQKGGYRLGDVPQACRHSPRARQRLQVIAQSESSLTAGTLQQVPPCSDSCSARQLHALLDGMDSRMR